jgi:hypothetical protein
VADIDASALLAFVVGIAGTASAFGAKYLFDYRLAKKRLELEERSSLATALGARPGQMRRAATRLHSRVESFERDAEHLASWLAPANRSEDDAYYLRSSVQRVFMYATSSALMQQAMDTLPHETMRVRRDLQDRYVLLDVASGAMTSIGMVEDFPGYPKDRAAYQLFTGTLDEVVDLGVGIHNRNSQVVPTAEFLAAYQAGERCLLQLRDWLSAMHRQDARGTIVTARMFAVGAILSRYLDSSSRSFIHDSELTRRLAQLSDRPAAQGYDFVGNVPRWLDEQLRVARDRWET